MKKKNYNTKSWFCLLSALTLLLVITVTGCKDDDKSPDPILEIQKNTMSFLQTGGNDVIEITTNQNWSFNTPPTWLTLSETSGKKDATVTVTATENKDYAPREFTLIVTAGSLSGRVVVSQPGLDPVLSVNPKNIGFEVDGGTETVSVTSNVTWTPQLSDGADSWLTITVSEDKTGITITSAPNTTAEQREATLTLEGNQEKSDVVTIIQDGPANMTITALRALAANSKTDYTYVTGLVTSDNTGKNIGDNQMIIQDGTGNAITLQFTEEHNIAPGTQVDVLLNGGSRTTVNGLTTINNLKTANITSVPTATITVNPTVKTIAEILAGEAGDGLLVKIENVEFKDITQTYGNQPILWNGTEELPLAVAATATFREQKVAAKNGAIIGHITNAESWKLVLRNTEDTENMTNDRLYDKSRLKLSIVSYAFGNQGGKLPVDITTDTDITWTATVSAGAAWCTLQPATGSGSGSFIVTTEAYSGDNERTATVTVTAPDLDPVTLEIIQTPTAKREFVLSRWSNSNLGAKLPATEENMSGPDYKDTWGMYYQWGRNVGFPHSGAETTIAANESITAEQAQEMTEFITSNGDWLTNPGSESVWNDRAGSYPCPSGYRLPNQMDLLRIYPSSEDKGTFSNSQSVVIYERLEDRPGVPDRTLYVYEGSSKIYAIKKFETADAYILRFEMLGEVGKNLYLKITEILADENTVFDNATDAEALFAEATESEVRIFPAAGMLNMSDGATLLAPGAAAWYWLDKKMRCMYILNTTRINEAGAICGYATPLRCIME